jgi:hypothetical protein
MRIAHLFPAILSVCLFSSIAAGQQMPQDPEAIVLLNKAIGAAGGAEAVRALQDFEASGTVTHYWAGKEVSGSVEIRGRGQDQVRMDSRVEGGLHSIVLNHGTGKISSPVATHDISAVNGANLGLLVFSLPTLVSAVDDPTTSLILAGTEQIGEIQARKIEVVRGLLPRFSQDPRMRRFKTLEVFVDPNTFMIIAVRHLYFPTGSSARAVLREVDFSDYKQVNGVMVPHTITEKAFDQPTWTVRLNNIAFNTGIREDAF